MIMDHPAPPPGYDSNPSAWSERLPIIGLALVGCAISTYLGLYQVGILSRVWDPFFGSNSSSQVLHSVVSRSLPVPDAILGACGYAAEMVLGIVGGARRWQTSPLLVIAFGLLSAGMGIVGIILTICQPTLAHAWCTLCLCSALISVSLAVLARRELYAGCGAWKARRAAGKHASDESHHWLHHRFFKGGNK